MKEVAFFFRTRTKSEIVLTMIALGFFGMLGWATPALLPRTILKIIAGLANFGGLLVAVNFMASALLNNFSITGNPTKPFSFRDSRDDLITLSFSLVAFALLAWWSTNFLPRGLVHGIAGIAVFGVLALIGFIGARVISERFSTDNDRIYR